MAEFASNVPISRPAVIPNLVTNVDLNGIFFSYDVGLCYKVYSDPSLIRLPAGNQ